MLAKVQAAGMSSTPMPSPLSECGLDNVDCPLCENRGYLLSEQDGTLRTKECECMNKRRSLRRIERSGMKDMLGRYTFDTYEVPDAARLKIKHLAKRFADDDTGWLFLSGQSGSGKTHICTAICSRLIERGKNVYYMRWRDESRYIKSVINTEEAEPRLEKLKQVSVLYIDDFLKGGCGEADIRLAFEIINDRYNDTSLRTLISSELSIKQILDADEALGSRIYERSKDYMLQAPKENWRMR